MNRARRIVLVSGPPGAGKSTLARPLAAALGMPLFTKDTIKESLADSLGLGDGSSTWSSKLGGAAMELMWKLAAQAPAAVLEANFRPRSDYEQAKIHGLAAQLVEVYCACPPEEAARRYTERSKRADQHAIHVLRAMAAEQMVEYDRPIGSATSSWSTPQPRWMQRLSPFACRRHFHKRMTPAGRGVRTWP